MSLHGAKSCQGAKSVSTLFHSEVRAQMPVTTRPFTYIIDYSGDHMDNPKWEEAIKAAPPHFLHVGHDIPLSSVAGPALSWDVSKFQPASRAQVQERIAKVKHFIGQMRALGVQKMIPYIVNCIMWGDHETRKGFWHFYDHWNEYTGFGFGAQPPQDPIDWQQEPRRPQQHVGGYWYCPCPNNPHWQRYLDDLARMIARCGYDGLFMDVNTCWCFCSACQAGFKRFMADCHTTEQLATRFDLREIAQASLREGAAPEYAAQVNLYRAESIGRNLRSVRHAAREIRSDFLTVANLGPMGNFDGFLHRTGSGKSVLLWAQACDYIMFEEWLFPGRLAPGVISEQILQYKLAFDLGGRAVVLDYKGGTEATAELAWAEAAAFSGGGAFVNPHIAFPAARRKYNAFFAENGPLYEGYRTYAQVGVPFLYDRINLGNVPHLRQVYRLKDALAEAHLLFEFLPSLLDEGRLAQVTVVVLPSVEFLRAEEDGALARYVERGGTVVALGSLRPAAGQEAPPDGLLALAGRAEVDAKGAGRLLLLPEAEAWLPEPPFALWQLTEDEMQPEGETERRAAEAAAAGPAVPGERLVGLLRGLLPASGTRCEGPGAENVRLNAFIKARGEDLLVVHLVNYAVPLLRPEEPPVPAPAGPLRIRLPLPRGFTVAETHTYSPDGAKGPAQPTAGEETLEFKWPSLKVYGAVALGLARR